MFIGTQIKYQHPNEAKHSKKQTPKSRVPLGF